MKIAKVEAFPIRLPRQQEQVVRTAGSPTPLAAGPSDYRWSTTVTALYSKNFETALVKLTTTDGEIGWGEAQAPLAPQIACTIIELLLKPVIEGVELTGDPAQIGDLWDLMYATMRVRGQTGGFMLDAIAGIDIALWDLLGKFHNKPVAALLSAAPKSKIPAYYSGIPGETIEARRDSVAQAQAQGFTIFKLFHNSTEAELFETLDAIQPVAAAGTRIAADALWRLSMPEAIQFGKELDARNILWLECPLMPEDPKAHAQLAQSIQTPLALGESYRSTHEIAPFLKANAMHYVQPDLGRCGITQTLRIAQQASAQGLIPVPHLSIALGPQIAAAIHVAAALNGCPVLEYNPNVFEVANQYLSDPLAIEQAHYQLPNSAGLGVTLNPSLLPSIS